MNENFELCKSLAEKIYSNVYGHVDDKSFRDKKTTEIMDWLLDGDQQHIKDVPVDALCLEWELSDL